MNATTLQAFGVPAGRITREGLDALYATGYWLHSQQRFSEGAAIFRAMVSCAPFDERGYLALGSCHEELGQEAIALEIYGAGTESAPLAPRCHLARARILRWNGNDAEAERSIDEADRIARETQDEGLQATVARERREQRIGAAS